MRQESTRTEDLATAEKEGFFTGQSAVNPFSGEKIPIWVGNFVLMEYGTGAIMAVPAHDQRDYEFAMAFELPIVQVVAPRDGGPEADQEVTDAAAGAAHNGAFVAHTENEQLINSAHFSGLNSVE